MLVTSVDPAVDISGVYKRSTNGVEVNITKVSTGLYKTDNVGGVGDAPEYIYDVYFGFPNDTTLIMPEQPNPLGGEVYGEDEKLIVTPTSTEFQWVVIGSGYGTALRRFIKQ